MALKRLLPSSGENKLKVRRYILLAFLCSAVIMALVYLMSRILPKGEVTILRMDLYHQYGPLFAELYERITNSDSLLYSWCSGLGSCFLGNYFNYMSSPIAAIIMLFGHNNIPEAIAAMVLIKVALSSAGFTYYLRSSLGRINFSTVAFGVMYSFCGYFIAYYWNVMWIDAMILLPFVALGIERIINKGQIRTYVTALALTMFSNYYMSFMMCIFSVMYFFIYFYSNYENGAVLSEPDPTKKQRFLTRRMNSRFFRSGVKFASGSLIAAGIIAFALIPTYLVLRSTSATSGSPPTDAKMYFNAFDFIANHLSGIDPTIRSSGENVLPNVFCGIMTVILVPLYVMTKSISKKEKIVYIISLALFYIGFAFNFLNYIWHGLHFPNDLPYRQSFMYTFILLIIAYKTFMRLNEFTSRQIAAAGMGVLVFIIIVQKVGSKNVDNATAYVSLVFALFYTILLIFFKDRRYTSVGLSVLMLVCVSSEILISDTGSYDIDQTKENFASDLTDFQDIKSYLDTLEQDKFYRMELSYLRTRMDPCWYYYNGVSTFSSMAYESTSLMMHNLGMYGNTINSYTYYPQTPVFNSFFGLKYIVNNSTPNVLDTNTDYYSFLSKIGKFSAYENNFDLPIGFCADSEVQDWVSDASNPFDVQGSLFSLSTGVNNPFKDIPISSVTYNNMNTFSQSLDSNYFTMSKINSGAEASCTLYLTPKTDGNIYLYFNANSYYNSSPGEGNIVINSESGAQNYNLDMDSILDIGHQKKGKMISIKLTLKKESKDTGNFYFYAASLNDALFEKGYNKLQKGQLNTAVFDDTLIEGSFTAASDCVFFTSIPYDTGWGVTIDGEPVEYAEYKENEDGKLVLADEDITGKAFKIGDGLLGISVSKGAHEISLKYSVKGLSDGIKVTAFTLIILALYIILKRFSIIEKLPVRRKAPAYPEYEVSGTNDLFICGENAYDSAEPVRRLTKVRLPEREIITPAPGFRVEELPVAEPALQQPAPDVQQPAQDVQQPEEEQASPEEPKPDGGDGDPIDKLRKTRE